MKILIAFLIMICLISCENEQEEIIIDGCQYIKTTSFVDGGYVESLVHKGNCNNPIHIYNVITDSTNSISDSIYVDPNTNWGFYPKK